MKTPTSIVASSLLAGFLLASCQSNQIAAAPDLPDGNTIPRPSWTGQTGKKSPRANSRKVHFSAKFIEITHEPGTSGLPSRLSQTKLSGRAYQGYLRKLSQKKGADIMTAPTVTSYEGRVGKTEVVRDFSYPDPSHPSEVVKDQTGVTNFFRARSFDGGKTYRLDVLGEVREFKRFQKLANGTEQPVFRTRRVGDTVSIADGDTVIFSGLVTDVERTMEEKVPYLGDIPLVGHLFSKKITETFPTELILAVTAEKVR